MLLEHFLSISSSEFSRLNVHEPCRQFTDASWVVATVLNTSLKYLCSLEAIKADAVLQSALATLLQSLSQCTPPPPPATILDQTASRLGSRSPFRAIPKSAAALDEYSNPVVTRNKLCDVRSQFSGSFKSFRNACRFAFEQRNFSTPAVVGAFFELSSFINPIDALVQLHRKTPFGIGGPELRPQAITKATESLSTVNVEESIFRLRELMSREGREWFSDCSPNASSEMLGRKQADLMDRFWSGCLDQGSRIPGQDSQPEFLELEDLLRRVVIEATTPTFRVAVIGIVKSGYVRDSHQFASQLKSLFW
jgi:hypothetical protein